MIDIFDKAYTSVMERALNCYLGQLTAPQGISHDDRNDDEIKKVELMLVALKHLPELMKAFR